MEHGHLKRLVEKYDNGTLTPSEETELNDWFHSLNLSGSDFDEWIAEAGGEAEMANSLLADFKHRIPLIRSSNPTIYKMKRVAAAASVLLCIGLTFYFYQQTKNQGSTIADHRTTVKDIMPGSNKAVLTLADGKQIVIDSASKGTLAQQNNVSINKTRNGSIAYTSTSGTPDTKAAYNTMATPRGGQYKLILSDGTKVWLNAASSIRYPVAFTGNERRVEITGEAYFEVVHNAARPFKVVTAGQTVEDIGTRFNVSAYPDEQAVKTTLIEGSVRIAKNSESVILKPGQQSQVFAASKNMAINVISKTDTVTVMAWKNGLFRFRSANVYEVMRQISRWYNVDVQYRGEIPGRRFTGEITRNVNVSDLLEIMSYLQVKFEFHQEGEKVIIIVHQ